MISLVRNTGADAAERAALASIAIVAVATLTTMLAVLPSSAIAGSAPGQTITFAAPATTPVNGGPVLVSGVASSGLVVTFSSLTPAVCAVGGTSVALYAVGTCTLRASQVGNAAYSPAPDVDRSFAILAGTQTINFPPPHDWTLGALPDALLATASSGLPVSYASLTPGSCWVTGAQVTLVAPGACTIRATQNGNANYNAAASVDRSFSVTGNVRAITFAPIGAQTLGASPIPISASAVSGVPVSFSSLTAGVCTVSGSLVTLMTTGVCTIRATLAATGSYPALTADKSFSVSANPPAQFVPPDAPGPLVEYASYLGGFGGDWAFDVVVANDGSAFVGGSLASTDFPGISSTTATNGGLDMLFISKINAAAGKQDFAAVVGGRAADITGSGLWSYVGATLGGNAQFVGGGQVEAMARDATGNVFVAAYADAADFPSRGGTYARSGAKYIFKINAQGVAQPISAAIDPAVMTIRALAIDGGGAIYFTGVAAPGLITTPGALIPSIPGASGPLTALSAPYLIKLAPGGLTTIFATYLSHPGTRAGTPDIAAPQSHVDAATTAYALAVDGAGNCYVAGQATSDQLPATAGSPDTIDFRHRDAFVAKLNATGTALLFVARLGGADAERATGIALSPDGSVVVGGKTATQPFLGTTNSLQSSVTFRPQTPYDERETAFVAKLAPDGRVWQFVATLGTDGGSLVGGVDMLPIKVAVDAAGAIYAAGTASPYRDLVMVNFSADVKTGNTVTHIDERIPAMNDLVGVDMAGAFVLKMAADGSRLIYLAALGGLSTATGLALDGFSNAYVVGSAQPDLLVVNANQAAPKFDGRQKSAFVAKINDRGAPLTLTADQNPSVAGQSVNLRAVVADARYSGTIAFDDAGRKLGSISLSAGAAVLPMVLAAGVHRLRAVFSGAGPFDGYPASELVLVVNQPPSAL